MTATATAIVKVRRAAVATQPEQMDAESNTTADAPVMKSGYIAGTDVPTQFVIPLVIKGV